jgi:uncharacterized ion transporter superfamily protein YfcC
MEEAAEKREEEQQKDEEQDKPSFKSKLIHFYFTYKFFILLIFTIVLVKAYLPLGAEYSQPQIMAEWIAVILIFGR